MAPANKVVVHYVNGAVLKGSTQDFAPNRRSFHLTVLGSGEVKQVKVDDLKAIFFVKSFDGVPHRPDVHGFGDVPAQGKKIAVLFRDGELLCGTTLSFSLDRQGFFVTPADKGSNNIRIYVISGSTAQVKAGPAAEKLAAEAA